MAAEAAGLLEVMVHRLGWEPSDDEDDRTRQLRGVLLAAAGTLADDPDIIGQARHRWASGTSTDPAVDGAVVTIDVVVQQSVDAVVVPIAAVLSDGGQDTVRVVTSEGVIERRAISTGMLDGAYVEVVSGVAPGEYVILEIERS